VSIGVACQKFLGVDAAADMETRDGMLWIGTEANLLTAAKLRPNTAMRVSTIWTDYLGCSKYNSKRGYRALPNDAKIGI